MNLREGVGSPIPLSGVLGFLLMAAYVPGIRGAPLVGHWIAGAAVMLVFCFGPRVKMTVAHWTGLVLCTWLVATLIWAPSADGAQAAIELLIVASLFCWGSTLDDIKPFTIGSALGLAISSVIIVAQEFVNLHLPHWGGPAALFGNGNYLAEAAALVIVALAVYERWLLIVLLLPALLIPQARGALIAAIVPMLFLVDKLRYDPIGWRIRFLVGAMALIAAIVFMQRGLTSAHIRLDYWYDTVMAFTFWGHGLGSFWETFIDHAHRIYQPADRPEHAHNDVLEIIYEGGAVAAVLLVAFAAAVVARCRRHPLAPPLVAFAILALFGLPLHLPATALFAAVVAGHCVRARGDDAVVPSHGGKRLRQRQPAHS
jgi:O-antigen ligase